MIAHHTYEQMKVAAFQEAKQGNTHCGDSYFVAETEDYFICTVVDGLGSGIEANQAAERAVSVVKAHHHEDIDTLMAACNQALSIGRGAVLSMFKIFFHSRKLVFSGVGNIRFIFYTPDGKMNYPLPTVGFLSGRPQSYRVQTFPYAEGSSFIVYSDGVEMSSQNRASFLGLDSFEEASRRVRFLLENEKGNDDVTFLFGKSV